MTFRRTIKNIAICALLTGTTATFAHVVLDEPAALAGTSYKAVFRVGHGCDGAPTNAITVFLPPGFAGAKPMPKPGWTLTTWQEKLVVPYKSHGKTVTEDVVQIRWSANARENWLPEAYYDEFVLRGGLPSTAGPLWFRVLQGCENASLDWAQIPASGTSTKGLKSPAALLDVIPSGPAGEHQH